MRSPDYYTVLGVEPTATQAEIVNAFNRVTTQNNAPFGRGFGGRFTKKLEEAYAVLTDEKRRQAYDESRRSG